MAEQSKKLDPAVYQENLEFWERAWSAAKKPYTQLPDLPYLAEMAEKLTQAGCQTVLDLGCGSGWLAVFLARAGFAVTGVDVVEHALDLARQWVEMEQLSAVFQCADIVKLPFPDSTFDACVANSIFEHLNHDLAVKCLAETRRVLKPGGLFFGCFDLVGTGPGEYYKLDDGSHIYTDKSRQGMLLRCFNDDELKQLFADWQLDSLVTIESGSRIVWART